MTLRADLSQLVVFLLVFCRVGGVLALAPVIGSQRVPVRIKAALALAVSLALAPCAGPAPGCRDTIAVALAAGSEVVLGLAIGFGARLIFSAIQIAGEMADAQSAFGFAGIVAPDTGERNSVIGQLQTAVATLIFLGADGHHVVLYGLGASLTAVPLGVGPGNCAPVFTAAAVVLLASSVRIAAPVVGAVVLADLALGLLTRAAPQMNLLAIGFPVKLAVGLVATLLSLPLLASAERGLIWLTEQSIRAVLLAAGQG